MVGLDTLTLIGKCDNKLITVQGRRKKFKFSYKSKKWVNTNHSY